MCSITLICTYHNESGICTSNELFKIIERIDPEIVFEEIPPSFFDEYYKKRVKSNLETDAISMYLMNRPIEHVPVDIYEIPAKFFRDNGFLHKQIESKSRDYKNLMDMQSMYIRQYGFKYLNSDYSVDINNKIYQAIEDTLKEMNNDKLFQIHENWNRVIKRRETEMIKNIYAYSNIHEYDKGVFLIGAAHRKSIIQIIETWNESKYMNINWNYNSYENIL